MKKFLSVLLSAIMATAVLSGCASDSSGNTSSTGLGAPSSKTEDKKSDTQKVDLSTKPTLKVLMPYVPFDPNTEATALLLESETGYKVQYDMLPMEDSQTKLNTIIASKADYDIMILTKPDFSNTVDTGAYMDLNDLLPIYAPDLQAKTAEGLWTNVTIDGKIKAVPEGLANENYGLSYRMRMDLFKQAGITAMPSNSDELYTALKAVKDKLSIIPLTSSTALIPEIASAFGVYAATGGNMFQLVDDKVTFYAAAPGAKDYVAYMNKLFTDGLLDNEYAQNTGDTMKEKFFSGKAATYQVGWWNEPGAMTTIKEKAPTAELAYLDPLKDSDGNSGLPMGRGINRVTVIPKASKNKEHALNYMNIKVDDEIFRKTNMGEEGVHYKKLSEDTFEPILPKFFDDKNNSHYFMTGSDTEAYSLFWSQTRVKKDPILYQEFNLIQETAKKATLHYDPTTFMQPNKTYSELIGKVSKLAEDAFKQLITGTRPMSEWDTFVNELNSTGLTEIDKIVNEWWAAEGASIKDQLIKKQP